MNASAIKKPKDRIIDVSTKLFYGHDAHTIGVDKICEIANVSKRTLYKHFPTKEFLVSASINTLAETWFDACVNINSNDPVERITHIFTMLEPRAQSDDFHGCVLMNTSIELRDSSALATNVAKDFKTKLYDYFKQQAILLGAKDPDMLAEQLVLLFDGCNAWIIMRHRFPASTLTTLTTLLRAHDIN